MTRRTCWKTALAWMILSFGTVCLAAFSNQAGPGWSAPLNLSSSAVDTEDASIIVDSNGRIHVVYSEGGEILHRFHDSNGWSAVSRVASGTSPHLAADASGGVHLAFANYFANTDDIYFASWRAATGWGLPFNVSEGVGVSSSPRLAIAADDSFAVIWSARSLDLEFIYAARSTDGSLWASWPIPNAHGTHPIVVFAPKGNLLVAWEGSFDEVGSPTEIFFSQQTGAGWTLPEDMSYSPEVNSCLPSLAAQGEDIYLAWQEGVSGNQAVYLCQMTDGRWSIPQKVSGSSPAFAPAVAFGPSDDGHLVWTTENAVQYVTWCTLTGTWQPIENIAVSQNEVSNAHLVVQGWMHVIWLAEASTDNRDLYYSAQVMPEPSPALSATPTNIATPTSTRTATSTPTPSLTSTHTATRSPSLSCTATSTPGQRTSTATPTSRVSWRVFLPNILRK